MLYHVDISLTKNVVQSRRKGVDVFMKVLGWDPKLKDYVLVFSTSRGASGSGRLA